MSDGTVADGVTAGSLLRAAREAAGLHVDTLAANLKVPVRKLEALEQDRYDLLGDAVFIRALASSVARTLKLDPQPVLGRLPQTSQPRLVPDTEGINAPFRTPGDGPSPGMLHHVSRPVLFTVAVLLIGALVIMFLPYVQEGYEMVTQANRSQPAAGAAAPAPGEAPVAAFPAAAPAAEPQPAPAGGPGPVPASAAPAAVSAPPAAAPATAAPTTVAPAPAAAASAATGAETPAAVPANAIVVFRTRGPSWIQVTDARGTTVLRRLMAAGESAGAGGPLPLSVTVGDAGQTDVQVRGKPFPLAPLARDNVARFDVK